METKIPNIKNLLERGEKIMSIKMRNVFLILFVMLFALIVFGNTVYGEEAKSTEVIDCEDKSFYNAIKGLFKETDITSEDDINYDLTVTKFALEQIKTIEFNQEDIENIRDVSGIEKFTKLESIVLNLNSINKLSGMDFLNNMDSEEIGISDSCRIIIKVQGYEFYNKSWKDVKNMVLEETEQPETEQAETDQPEIDSVDETTGTPANTTTDTTTEISIYIGGRKISLINGKESEIGTIKTTRNGNKITIESIGSLGFIDSIVSDGDLEIECSNVTIGKMEIENPIIWVKNGSLTITEVSHVVIIPGVDQKIIKAKGDINIPQLQVLDGFITENNCYSENGKIIIDGMTFSNIVDEPDTPGEDIPTDTTNFTLNVNNINIRGEKLSNTFKFCLKGNEPYISDKTTTTHSYSMKLEGETATLYIHETVQEKGYQQLNCGLELELAKNEDGTWDCQKINIVQYHEGVGYEPIAIVEKDGSIKAVEGKELLASLKGEMFGYNSENNTLTVINHKIPAFSFDLYTADGEDLIGTTYQIYERYYTLDGENKLARVGVEYWSTMSSEGNNKVTYTINNPQEGIVYVIVNQVTPNGYYHVGYPICLEFKYDQDTGKWNLENKEKLDRTSEITDLEGISLSNNDVAKNAEVKWEDEGTETSVGKITIRNKKKIVLPDFSFDVNTLDAAGNVGMGNMQLHYYVMNKDEEDNIQNSLFTTIFTNEEGQTTIKVENPIKEKIYVLLNQVTHDDYYNLGYTVKLIFEYKEEKWQLINKEELKVEEENGISIKNFYTENDGEIEFVENTNIEENLGTLKILNTKVPTMKIEVKDKDGNDINDIKLIREIKGVEKVLSLENGMIETAMDITDTTNENVNEARRGDRTIRIYQTEENGQEKILESDIKLTIEKDEEGKLVCTAVSEEMENCVAEFDKGTSTLRIKLTSEQTTEPEDKIIFDVKVEYEVEDEEPIHNLILEVENGTAVVDGGIESSEGIKIPNSKGTKNIKIIPNESGLVTVHIYKIEPGDNIYNADNHIWVEFTKAEDGKWTKTADNIAEEGEAEFKKDTEINRDILTINLETQ